MKFAKRIAAITVAVAMLCTLACPVALAADEQEAKVIDYAAYVAGKKAQPAKSKSDVVDLYTFDDDKGTEIGDGFYLS